MGALEWIVFGAGVPLFTYLFLELHRRLGLGPSDDPTGSPERKLQAHAVPMIGGPALFATGVLYFLLARLFGLGLADRGTVLLTAPHVGAALVGAFLVGLFDDLREGGLAAGPKVLLQVVASLPLYSIAPGSEGFLLVLAGVVAMNAINTFDNADGAVTGLLAATFAPVAPSLALALAVFLPVNLGRAPFGARPGAPERRPATAYLGDSGSHLLGMLLLFLPGAWVALWLPLLDLARVSWQRKRAGQPPWVGDRRHLAHRMEACGWPPWLVALGQVVIAAPALFIGTSGLLFENLLATVLGLGATLVLFAATVVATRTGGAGAEHSSGAAPRR
jgi:UDP-N-acetylmuramyl pentapeptide phosphotransferase/UDP-N-acetylglucosamine-1-phosphate transferase